MSEMQIAMMQDASKDAALSRLSLRKIAAKIGAASVAQTSATADMFARLANGDISGFRPFFMPPQDRGDGRAEVSIRGACLADVLEENDAVVLAEQEIAPGDLCQLALRGGFGLMVKQYLGRWNGDYEPFSGRTSDTPGYLFFQSRPAMFLIVHPDDLLGATRVTAIKRSGVESEVTPWHVDYRMVAAFAGFLSSLPVNEETLPSTPIKRWSALLQMSATVLGKFLWLRSGGRKCL